MCHFIKLVLPAQTNVPALREIVERHRRVLEPLSEPSVDRELLPGDRVFLTTRTCDCGTGLANQRSKRTMGDEDREVARHRRDGWSEAKIARWRDQRRQIVTEKAAKRAMSREGELEDWRVLLTELLDAQIDHVGLLIHWVTDEVRPGPTLSRDRLTAETLGSLEENVAYTFVRRRGPE